MLVETHHFILIIIYTACSECKIFRNLQGTKMARVGKSRFNAHIIMEIAHPLFLMKVHSKFEISEKTESKDYSLAVLTTSTEIILGTRKCGPCQERVFSYFKLQESIEALKSFDL